MAVTRYKINEIGIDGCDAINEDANGEWIRLADHEAALARRPTREWEHALQMTIRGKNDAIAELNKKLAEKDRASNELREKQGEALRKALEDCNKLVKEKDDIIHQAVRFAEAVQGQAHGGAMLGGDHAYQALLRINGLVTTFLSTPEVQVYQAQEKK